MTTASELAEKRQKIAKYELEDLKAFNLGRLRELASGLVPGSSKMKKAKLIEELVAATKAERVLGALIPDTPLDVIQTNEATIEQAAELLDNADLANRANGLYKELRAMVQSRYKEDGSWDDRIHADIAGLAYKLMLWLNEREGKQVSGGLSPLTKLRYRTQILNLLTDLIEAERGAVYFAQLESCIPILKRQIKIQIADISKEKKGRQERRISERKEEKEVIDFRFLYEFASDILSRIDELKPRDWKYVSVALAIVTGRRLAEIHRTATKFELITNEDLELSLNGGNGRFLKEMLLRMRGKFSDEFIKKTHVKFTGQLKDKDNAARYFALYPAYFIPVLVDANLVLKAHYWLKENEKTVADFEQTDGRFKGDEGREKSKILTKGEAAHRRYSGDLSNFVRTLKKQWNIEHSFFSYKGLRAIYSDVCNYHFNNNSKDDVLYIAGILGHGRSDLLVGETLAEKESAKLVDLITPQSYKSDFEIVNADCVQLPSAFWVAL